MVCAWSAAALSAVVLIGWVTHWWVLTHTLPGQIQMKANTAIGILAIALATLLLQRAGASGSKPTPARGSNALSTVARALASLTLIIGIVAAAQYALGVGFHFDELFFDDPIEAGELTPAGRMAPTTAVSLVLLGSSALLLALGALRRLTVWLTCGGGAVPLFVLVGYLYAVPGWSRSGPRAVMAANTALALLLLTVALLAMNAEAEWFHRVFDPASYAARLARRVFGFTSIAIICVGWIRLVGERAGLYSTAEGLALASVFSMCLGLGVVAVFTRLLRDEERVRHDRERDLIESEARWRAMFDHAQVGMVQTAPGGRLFLANAKFHELLGFTPEELRQKTWAEITLPAEVAESADAVARVLRGESSRIELYKHYVRKDGSPLLAHVVSAPVRHPSGEVAYFVTAIEDVTERRRSEQALRLSDERFRLAARATEDIVYDWNISEDRIWWGEALARLGYQKPSHTLEWWSSRVHEDDRADVERLLFEALRGPDERWQSEYRFQRADGTFAVIHERGFIVRDDTGRAVRMIGAMSDVTMRREAEEVLRDSHAALQKMVAERTSELRVERDRLQVLAGELQTANVELEAFSYSVSHDLRAPLRSIDGFSQALAEDAGDALDDQARSHLARVRAAAARMGNLIDDLLELSRVSRAVMSMGEADLSAMGLSIARRLCEETGREVRIEIEPRLTVRADAQLMGIVLENLLSNAWKFTSRKAEPSVGLGRSADGSFFVRDNGVGFDTRHADKLFVPFQRLHRVSEYPGTGIGLATVRRIIRKHGGDVRAESEPGRGATFYFTVPSDGDSA